MPGNVLTGVINITAPGVVTTFNQVSNGIKGTQASLAKLNPGLSILGNNLETLKAKLGARQSFLNVETDITKVKILNQEIRQLQIEIKRVEGAGVSGGFGAIGTGATKAFSAVRQLAYVLPGIGIAGIVGGLSELVVGLFKSADGFDKTSLSAAQFTVELKNAKDGLQQFLDFVNSEFDLSKLALKLKFPSGGINLKNAEFENDLQRNTELINSSLSNIERLNKRIDQIRSDAAFLLSKQGLQLIRAFPVAADVPEELINKLGAADKKLLKEFKSNGELIEAERKTIANATEDNNKIEIQKKVAFNDEKIRLDKLSVAELKKLREQEQQEALRQISEQNARIVAVFKERLKALENGIKLADEFKRKMDLALVAAGGTSGNKQGGVTGTGAGSGEGLAKAKKEFADYEAAFKSMVDNVNSSIDQLKIEALSAIGEAIGTALVGGNLSNVFKNFADTLGGALQALGREFIKFGIIGQAAKTALKAFGSNPALAVAAGIALVAAGSALKSALSKGVQARALGGPVNKGGAFLVGERGPELFVPNIGGNIVPNNRLGGVSGGGGMQFQVIGTNIIQGMDLLQIFTLAQQSQRRLQ